MATTTQGPYMLPSVLPHGNEVIFRASSYFSRGNNHLPSPNEVKEAAGNRFQTDHPPPVSFPSLGLLVKYGAAITEAEGQCLWAIRRFVPSVPVPEVYGWCRSEGQLFIYMELIDGTTLAEDWPEMDTEERYQICGQLSHVIEDLRTLKQHPSHPFIGDIAGGPLHDIKFDGKNPVGPFPDVHAFNEYWTTIGCSLNNSRPIVPQLPDPWRPGLEDNVSIIFTHNDLHRSNILIRWENNRPRIAALIDWHQSGWLPEPWEFFKTRVTSKGHDQWELDFILEFLKSYRGFVSWEWYQMRI